jgi:hypothetical protein
MLARSRFACVFAVLCVVAPLAVSGWIQDAKLASSDAQSSDGFGWSLAIAGDTAVVGAIGDNHAPGLPGSLGDGEGSAYVLERSGTVWTQQAKLLPATVSPNDSFFGAAVAIEGDTAFVGAGLYSGPAGQNQAGVVYLYERDQGGPNSWGVVTRIVPSQVAQFDRFGDALGLSGDTLVVGAYLDSHTQPTAGSAYVFERNQGGPNAWGEVTQLIASDAATSDYFGAAVAISGDTVVIGARFDDNQGGINAGSVYVFERDLGGPGAWGQAAKLTASDGAADDQFGGTHSLGIDGDTVVVGAWRDDNIAGVNVGAAYVFQRDQGGPGAWGEVVKLAPSAAADGDRVGFGVAVSNDTAFVGAPNADHSAQTNAGAIYLFDRNQGGTNAWGQVARLTASDAGDDAFFGGSVAVGGGTVAVGAYRDDHSGLVDPGSVYILSVSSGSAYCTAGVSASGCQASIDVSGTASSTAVSGFDLSASGVEGDENGLFFFGANGRQAKPWGNGTSFQCVVPPVARASLLAGTGTTGSCDGSFGQDLNALWCPSCPKPAKNPGAGAVVQAQLWYRDPLSTSNRTTSLSNAIDFCVGP